MPRQSGPEGPGAGLGTDTRWPSLLSSRSGLSHLGRCTIRGWGNPTRQAHDRARARRLGQLGGPGVAMYLHPDHVVDVIHDAATSIELPWVRLSGLVPRVGGRGTTSGLPGRDRQRGEKPRWSLHRAHPRTATCVRLVVDPAHNSPEKPK
jgi:hypothetical protein